VTTTRDPSSGSGSDDATQSVQAVATESSAAPDTDPHGVNPVADAPTSDAPSAEASRTAPPPGAGPQQMDPLASEIRASASTPGPRERIRSAVRRTGKVRKARLRLLRVEPWSVMKTAFVLSIAIGITFVVAVATLWSIIDAAGVFEAVGGLVTDLTESESASGVDVTEYVGFSRVVGLATVIAVVDVILLTALATLFAFLYNLSASLLGGFEITLAEDD
jgi:hypothetical protein